MRTMKLGLIALATAALLNAGCSGNSGSPSIPSDPGEGGASSDAASSAGAGNGDHAGTVSNGPDCVAPTAVEVPGDFWNLQVLGDTLYVAEFDRHALTTTTYARILSASTRKVSEVATVYRSPSRVLQDYLADEAGLIVLEHAPATSTDGTEAFTYRVPNDGGEPMLIGPKGTSGYGDDARLLYVDDAAAYVGTDKAFYRVDLQTGAETKIAEHGRSSLPREIQVLRRDLWFMDSASIYRVSLDDDEGIPQRVYLQGCLLDGAMRVTSDGIFCGGNVWLELLALDGSGRRKFDQPNDIEAFLNPRAVDGSEIYLASQNSPLYRLTVDLEGTLSGPSIISCDGPVLELHVTPDQALWLASPSKPTDDFHFSLYALSE